MGQLISSTIPGFFNGISQQSVTMRLDTQGELQVNALGTIVDGLYTRPHSEHVAVINGVSVENAFIHIINRDLDERYVVFISGDIDEPIEVFKVVDGTKCTVRFGSLDKDLVFTEDLTVKTYLGSIENLAKSYKLLSIADYTLIVNRTKTTEMSDEVSTGEVTDRVQTFLDLPDEWTKVKAYDVAKEYTKGSLVKYDDRKVYYYINDTDGAGHLPSDDVFWREEYTYCSEGEIFEITGDEGNNFDNYFVKFTDGAWGECLAPNEPYKLKGSTLPHRLVRTAENEFTFAQILWEERVVGDDDSCPIPSFIGKKITNMTFFKNRLGFMASDSLFFSRAGRYFELFGETAIDLLDDDPIDSLASSNRVVKLYSSIVFDKNLMVNSAQGQFSFGSSGANLTPTTATLTSTTMYETSPDSDPVGAGANVYFVNPREKYVSIMEYLIQPDTLVEDASNVTAHCPHYIPNGTITLMSCVPMDMLIAYSDADKRSLYVYKYYWVGNEKPQSAWSKWEFDGDILGCGLINTTLYYIIKRGDETCLEKIQLENVAINPDFDYRVCLDRQIRIQGVFNGVQGTTEFTLPYDVESLDKLVCVNPATGFHRKIISKVGKTISVVGDRTVQLYTVGTSYEMRYRFSEWYAKDAKKVSIIDGKLQIRTLTLSFRDTGAFRIEITPERRATRVKRFSGVKIGSSKIGKASLLTGEEKFLIMAKSKYTTIDIVADSYLPCQFISASFEGLHVARATRM